MATIMASSSIMSRRQLSLALGGWAFFIAENAILSENRSYLIEKISSQGYYALYGTASTAATAGILYGFRQLSLLAKTASATRMPPSIPRIGLAIAIQSTGLILASQAIPSLQIPIAFHDSQVQVRCPFDFARDRENTGMDRVSRHASLWALGLTAAGASLLQSTAAMSLWMTGPTFVALIGGAHADSRFRRGLGGELDPEYEQKTSNIPFYAMIQQGTMSYWLQEEVKPLNAMIAIGMATVWAVSRRNMPVGTISSVFRKSRR